MQNFHYFTVTFVNETFKSDSQIDTIKILFETKTFLHNVNFVKSNRNNEISVFLSVNRLSSKMNFRKNTRSISLKDGHLSQFFKVDFVSQGCIECCFLHKELGSSETETAKMLSTDVGFFSSPCAVEYKFNGCW